MLARYSIYYFAAALAIALLSQGCIEPEAVVEVPEVKASEQFTSENTLFFLVVNAQNDNFRFTVYAGDKLDPDLRFDAQTETELTKLITSHVDDMTNINPSLDTVLIDCDGSLKTGEVELVKSGVNQSTSQSIQKVFIKIRDDETRDDVDNTDDN